MRGLLEWNAFDVIYTTVRYKAGWSGGMLQPASLYSTMEYDTNNVTIAGITEYIGLHTIILLLMET